MTKFSQEMVQQLRDQYDSIERVDPSGVVYKKLVTFLDSLPDEVLVQLAEAKIKWVSSLSINRCNRRGLRINIG